MREQIAIHYTWQLVIYVSQKNRLDVDINRGLWELRGRTGCLRAAQSVPRSKHTVIIRKIVQIIIPPVFQVGESLPKVL